MARKKPARNKRKREKFEKLHPGMTRGEWAEYKRKNGLPKIINTKNI